MGRISIHILHGSLDRNSFRQVPAELQRIEVKWIIIIAVEEDNTDLPTLMSKEEEGPWRQPSWASGSVGRRKEAGGDKMTCLLAFMLTVLIGAASAQHVVEYLPGYSGTGKIPFTMETGYIGVGDMEEVQLFYYFVESERDPSVDPLMLWLTGGPGCSGFSPLAFQIGPMIFDYDSYNGGLPTWRHAKHSWTKAANIIFIDQPVGAGFSYSTTTQGSFSDDKKAAFDAYTFLRKWLLKHPQFLGNQLYIGGDSYSGIIVPLVVNNILIGLENGDRPRMDLQGYVLGNPVTDTYIDPNSRIPYVHRVNLISDKYYQDAVTYCGGDYVNIDANNTLCIATMKKIKQCLLQINLAQILEPQCAFASKKTEELEFPFKGQEAEYIEHLLSDDKLPAMRCRGFTYVLAYKWLNDAQVRRALNVREGTAANWHRCWKTFSNFTEEVTSTIPYHKNFTNTGLRALIYSGDHDVSVPYLSTMTWIKSLGLPVFDEWRPWYVDGQIAGYQVKYMNDNYRLTYVTLKGAGHTGPEYKPHEALEMFDRFVARYPI
ncbi:hypothetical protein MLD38_023284 [Melastoma candidum]|uniref:Uncharacterized protein n=1 Tax=Melastoma candidum TaxID=119954 RepID=A0ACB9QNT6_9MYRT|nr:hypothetical protein MLD38_023284 [Melastoma candidum]